MNTIKGRTYLMQIVEKFMFKYCLGNNNAMKKSDILSGLTFDHNLNISERCLRRILSSLRKDGVLSSNNTIGWWAIDLTQEGETMAVLQGLYEKKKHALDMLKGINKELDKYESVLRMKESD